MFGSVVDVLGGLHLHRQLLLEVDAHSVVALAHINTGAVGPLMLRWLVQVNRWRILKHRVDLGLGTNLECGIPRFLIVASLALSGS